MARRRVAATARCRVWFRRGGCGVPRSSARRVFARARGAVTRDARDRGRARLRRARARGTRRRPAAGRADGRLGRAFHRTPHPARRPARPTSRVARLRNPRARRLRTAANRRAAPPAPGPHASAGLPLRCAPRADRRHPRAKSLSRLACHTICGARVEAPAPTPRPLPSSDGRQPRTTEPRAQRRYYFSFPRGARKRESLSVARCRIFLRKMRLIIRIALVMLRRIFLFRRPKRRVKKSYDFLLHARPRTLDRAEAGCAWRWEGVIDRERWKTRDVRTAG